MENLHIEKGEPDKFLLRRLRRKPNISERCLSCPQVCVFTKKTSKEYPSCGFRIVEETIKKRIFLESR